MFSRGYVYSRNPDIGPGKVAYGDSHILYRPLSYDQEGEQQNFFQVLDKHTLQVTPVDKIWGVGEGVGLVRLPMATVTSCTDLCHTIKKENNITSASC